MNNTVRTSNGKTVRVGYRVLTNDWEWGVIEKIDDHGWAYVRSEKTGLLSLHDGEQLSTRTIANAV